MALVPRRHYQVRGEGGSGDEDVLDADRRARAFELGQEVARATALGATEREYLDPIEDVSLDTLSEIGSRGVPGRPERSSMTHTAEVNNALAGTARTRETTLGVGRRFMSSESTLVSRR